MSADPSFSDEFLQTVLGTTTAFLPVATPWPLTRGCSSLLYQQFPNGGVIAFDPIYVSLLSSSNQCLPPEATVRWDPPADGKTVYVLGPTFVCPAAYYAVQTLVVDSATQQILCCPTSYTLGSILTHNPRTDFPNQCYSKCTSAQVITYLTQSVADGPWSPFTRTMESDPWIIYAIHVNGYNFMASTKSSSSSSFTSSAPSTVSASTTSSPSTSAPTTATSQMTSSTSAPITSTSSGLSSGAAAGIGVGVAAVILIAAILAFVLYRRRKRYAKQQALVGSGNPTMRQGMEGHKSSQGYYAGIPTHELPTEHREQAYELH